MTGLMKVMSLEMFSDCLATTWQGQYTWGSCDDLDDIYGPSTLRLHDFYVLISLTCSKDI